MKKEVSTFFMRKLVLVIFFSVVSQKNISEAAQNFSSFWRYSKRNANAVTQILPGNRWSSSLHQKLHKETYLLEDLARLPSVDWNRFLNARKLDRSNRISLYENFRGPHFSFPGDSFLKLKVKRFSNELKDFFKELIPTDLSFVYFQPGEVEIIRSSHLISYPHLSLAFVNRHLALAQPLIFGLESENFVEVKNELLHVLKMSFLSYINLSPIPIGLHWESDTESPSQEGLWYLLFEVPSIVPFFPSFTIKSLTQLENHLERDLTPDQFVELEYFEDFEFDPNRLKSQPKEELQLIAKLVTLKEYLSRRTDFIRFQENGKLVILENENGGLNFSGVDFFEKPFHKKIPLNSPFGRYTLLRMAILIKLFQSPMSQFTGIEYLKLIQSNFPEAWRNLGELYITISQTNDQVQNKEGETAEAIAQLYQQILDQIPNSLQKKLSQITSSHQKERRTCFFILH